MIVERWTGVREERVGGAYEISALTIVPYKTLILTYVPFINIPWYQRVSYYLLLFFTITIFYYYYYY